MYKAAILLLFAALLAGCDPLSERLGIPVAAKVEAEGKAIGGACRHAGRGLEDCYRLNPRADKPAIYAGWKEMNEYMLKNAMQSVPPTIPPALPAGGLPGTTAHEPTGDPGGKPAEAMAAGQRGKEGDAAPAGSEASH